jgi:hypothetical protein
MEKLIELLNEYNEIHNYAHIEYYDDETNGFETNYVAFYKTCIIISKQFWFIKWLVENDKIDLWEKLFNLTKNDNRKSIICDLDNNDFSWEDTFLMLLSISSSPIDDLISYLK